MGVRVVEEEAQRKEALPHGMPCSNCHAGLMNEGVQNLSLLAPEMHTKEPLRPSHGVASIGAMLVGMDNLAVGMEARITPPRLARHLPRR